MRRLLASGTITWDGQSTSGYIFVPAPAQEEADLLLEIDDSDDCGKNLTGTVKLGAAADSFVDILLPSTIELDTWEAPSIAITKGTHKFYGPVPGSIIGRHGLRLILTAAEAPTNEKETNVKVWECPRYRD